MKNLKYWLSIPFAWVGMICYWFFLLTFGAFACGWIIARDSNSDELKKEKKNGN